MKVEKFKVLLYLKKSGTDKSGKAPIMGRITVNRTMAQFGCKLSCKPELWNARESRLDGKSREAVETNAKLDKLLLAVNAAFDTLVERGQDFDATAVKDLFQGSIETQMTLLRMTDRICEDLKARIGIDRAKGTYPGYYYMRKTLGEFIPWQFKTKDIAFGQLTEQFIHDYQNYVMDVKGLAVDTVRHYLAILKKVCRIAYKEGYAERCHVANFTLPHRTGRTPRAVSREELEAALRLMQERLHSIRLEGVRLSCSVGALPVPEPPEPLSEPPEPPSELPVLPVQPRRALPLQLLLLQPHIRCRLRLR